MPAQGKMMSSPASDSWWGQFHEIHGRDGEEERAFTGYLAQKDIPAGSPPDVLAQAYADCVAFIEASYTQGEQLPERATLEALAARARPSVPRSSLADPAVHEKPMQAATRPPDLRDPEAAKEPSPLTPPAGQEPPSPASTTEQRGRTGRSGSET
jgi:hypothetical protein